MKKEFKTLVEELNRIKELSGVKLNEQSERENQQIWDDVYRWLEVFSTDKNFFLIKNNITSGEWLRRAVESGEVKPEQLDRIATNGELVYSKLPILMKLKK